MKTKYLKALELKYAKMLYEFGYDLKKTKDGYDGLIDVTI
jgi:hypothetical protein